MPRIGFVFMFVTASLWPLVAGGCPAGDLSEVVAGVIATLNGVAATDNAAPDVTDAQITITGSSADGTSMTIRCTATDADGAIATVEADLTALGGDAHQALDQQADGAYQWDWVTTTDPESEWTVALRVTDDAGAPTVQYLTGAVSSANDYEEPWGFFSSMTRPFYGELYSECDNEVNFFVHFVCRLESVPPLKVWVDLSGVGASALGETEVVLETSGPGDPLWLGSAFVRPTSAGQRSIVYHAEGEGIHWEATVVVDVKPLPPMPW